MYAGFHVFTTKCTIDKLFDCDGSEDFIKGTTQLLHRERADLANKKYNLSGKERIVDPGGRTVHTFPQEFIQAVEGIIFNR